MGDISVSEEPLEIWLAWMEIGWMEGVYGGWILEGWMDRKRMDGWDEVVIFFFPCNSLKVTMINV